MAQQNLNLGASEGDTSLGVDHVRAALLKVQANFSDLYENKLGDADDGSALTVRASGGSTSRTLADHAGETLNIRDFGAYEDNSHDDGPAFSAAISALNAMGGGTLVLNAKTYLLASATTTIAAPIMLRGQPPGETMAGGGTWLNIAGTDFAPFSFGNVGARGAVVQDIGISQSHPAPGSGWAPTVYPPVFQVGTNPAIGPNGQVTFRRILAAPVYALIDAYLAGRLFLDDIRGQVFAYLLRHDKAYDLSRATNLHVWPYWSADPTVTTWTQVNTTAIILRRVDGFHVSELFVYAAKAALQLDSSANDATLGTAAPGGICRFFSFQALYADATQYAVWATGPASANDYMPCGRIDRLVANGANGVTPIPGGYAIRVDGALDLSVGSLWAERYSANIVSIANAAGLPAPSRLVFGDFCGSNFCQGTPGAPAVFALPTTSGAPHTIDVGRQPTLINTSSSPFSGGVGNAVIRAPGNDVLVVSGSSMSGGATAMPNDRAMLLLEPTVAGALATYGVTLPANPRHGDEVVICCTQAVTTFSLTADVLMVGAPTALVADVGVRMKYLGIGTGAPSWVRLA